MTQKTGQLIGLIVSAARYNETSAVITLATEEEGLVSFYAGRVYDAKSQLKPMLIIGSTVEVYYAQRGGSSYSAKQVRVIYDGSVLYQSYDKTCFLLLMQELCQKFFDFGDSFPVSDARKIVSSLAEGGDPLSLALLLVGTLYRSLGVNIDVSECVVCHKTSNIVSYDLDQGGFVCTDCAKKLNLSSEDEMNLHVLRYAFMKVDPKSLGKTVPPSHGEKVLRELVSYLCSSFDTKEIKSLTPFIEGCRNR